MLKDWDISRDSTFILDLKYQTNRINIFMFGWMLLLDILHQLKIANKHSFNLEDIINSDSEYELIHFIGKDISYFHALFWLHYLIALITYNRVKSMSMVF